MKEEVQTRHRRADIFFQNLFQKERNCGCLCGVHKRSIPISLHTVLACSRFSCLQYNAYPSPNRGTMYRCSRPVLLYQSYVGQTGHSFDSIRVEPFRNRPLPQDGAWSASSDRPQRALTPLPCFPALCLCVDSLSGYFSLTRLFIPWFTCLTVCLFG